MYSTVQVSNFLRVAPRDDAALAASGNCDLTLTNADADLALAALRTFVSARWRVVPHAQAVQAIVQVYEVSAASAQGPRPTARRLQHVAATATTLDLPRGRHVLRIAGDAHCMTALTVLSQVLPYSLLHTGD